MVGTSRGLLRQVVLVFTANTLGTCLLKEYLQVIDNVDIVLSKGEGKTY